MKTDKTTWDLSPLLGGGDEEYLEKQRKAVEEHTAIFVSKWKPREDYLKDDSALAEALADYNEWRENYGTAGSEEYYQWLLFETNLNNPDVKARLAKAEDFSNRMSTEMDFFEIRLSKIPPATAKQFLESPLLLPYRHFLERLFAQSAHILSEPEEKILTLKQQTANEAWQKMVSGFLAKEERDVETGGGGREKKPLSALQSLMSSTDKSVRDSAAEGFNSILAAHVDAAEAEMNSLLADKKINDELRGFARPDNSRHLSDDIETQTVDALIASIAGKFSVAQDFYALKARLLGVEKLAYHERSVPYGTTEKVYPYDEAANLVHAVFSRLDPQFGDIFSRLLESGSVDVYPRKGKASGAFCAHQLKTHPTYILLNHTDKLNDVLTLAHEMGHAINNELSRAAQPAIYFGTSTATAEVASTFMEDFVLERILETADDELRLSLMMMKLNDDVTTIFRQAACYLFETDLHAAFRKKGYLSKEEIGTIFQKNMSAYMGPAVEQGEGSQNWWVYWSHIRSYFYVYSYASGLLISKALQSAVKKDPSFIEKVKGFLSAGISDSAKGIFARLGADISRESFWSEGLAEVEDLLARTKDLARKLGKI